MEIINFVGQQLSLKDGFDKDLTACKVICSKYLVVSIFFTIIYFPLADCLSSCVFLFLDYIVIECIMLRLAFKILEKDFESLLFLRLILATLYYCPSTK